MDVKYLRREGMRLLIGACGFSCKEVTKFPNWM